MFYNQFISFFGTNLVPSVSCYFFLVFYFVEYPYQTKSNCHETFWRFFSGDKRPWKLWEGTRRRRCGPLGTKGLGLPWYVVGPMSLWLT